MELRELARIALVLALECLLEVNGSSSVRKEISRLELLEPFSCSSSISLDRMCSTNLVLQYFVGCFICPSMHKVFHALEPHSFDCC